MLILTARIFCLNYKDYLFKRIVSLCFDNGYLSEIDIYPFIKTIPVVKTILVVKLILAVNPPASSSPQPDTTPRPLQLKAPYYKSALRQSACQTNSSLLSITSVKQVCHNHQRYKHNSKNKLTDF